MTEIEDPDPQQDQPLQTPLTTVTPDPHAHTQVREASEGSVGGPMEGPRKGAERSGGEEEEEEEEEEEDEGRDSSGKDEEWEEAREEGVLNGCGERERGDGGPVQEEGLQVGQLHTASGEFESDPSFQNTDDTF